jgi:hypothetical protein
LELAAGGSSVLQGSARMTVFMPVDHARIMGLPRKWALSRSSRRTPSRTRHDDLVFLEMFAAPKFLDVSLNQWIRHSPKLIVKGPHKPRRSGNRWDTGRQDASTYAIVARVGSHEEM